MDEAILLKQLQKSFRKIQSIECQWSEELKKSLPVVRSLINLLEQVECVRKVELTSTALFAFPDVQERLVFKIELQIEEDIETLQDSLLHLNTLNDDLSKEDQQILSIYNQHSDQLDIDTVSRATVFRPSITQMLEWSDDIHKCFNMEFLKLKCLLEEISCNDSSSAAQLASFVNSSMQKDWFNEIYTYLGPFLKEDL